MKKTARNLVKMAAAGLPAAALSLIVGIGMPTGASADEADAKRLLKAMSDYVAAQEAVSFNFDATLEVITKDDQKLALASSGSLTLSRSDKLRATRSGGHADLEMLFDGKTLTLFGKTDNIYTQIDVPGSIDHLVNELRETYNRPLPGADLLISNSYEKLMRDVVDIKDLGSGVIGGVECDYLAFRKDEVDWQIWIAQGDHPYPCRYVIASKRIAHSPQYSIQLRDWKTAGEVAEGDFGFSNPTNAEEIDLEALQQKASDLPQHFKLGD